jgi:hypothetical protein
MKLLRKRHLLFILKNFWIPAALGFLLIAFSVLLNASAASVALKVLGGGLVFLSILFMNTQRSREIKRWTHRRPPQP